MFTLVASHVTEVNEFQFLDDYDDDRYRKLPGVTLPTYGQ